MGIEFNSGTLYMIGSDGNQIRFGDDISGLVEIDTLSADETPNVLYNFTNDMSASFEVSMLDLSFLDELTFKNPIPTEDFNIEHNVPILVQARWHKKKRINKKWLKRYGMKPDTVKMRATARTLSYNTETGECEFEVDKLEYLWRPDQKKKNLKIEV